MIKKEELQEFQEKFKLLVEAFHNTILTQGQDVGFTNLSDIQNNYINLHIYYKKANGKRVQVETMGVVDHRYRRTLDIIGHALWGVAREAEGDHTLSLPGISLPTSI